MGFLFQSLIHLPISVSNSLTLRWADLRSSRLVSSAIQRSRFIQEELAGVKCRWNRGCLSSQSLTAGVLCGARLLSEGV